MNSENCAEPSRDGRSYQEIPADFKLSRLSFFKRHLNNTLRCRVAARCNMLAALSTVNQLLGRAFAITCLYRDIWVVSKNAIQPALLP